MTIALTHGSFGFHAMVQVSCDANVGWCKCRVVQVSGGANVEWCKCRVVQVSSGASVEWCKCRMVHMSSTVMHLSSGASVVCIEP